jgi:predicted transcriptional regulator
VEMDNFKIEERRRKVRSLLAEGNTEVDIAKLLGVGQATVSRDITALKEDSQKYIYDLAKTDLAYSYRQCIDEIDKLRTKAWEILRLGSQDLDIKDRLLTIRVIKELAESKFSLFEKGPSMLNIKALNDKVDGIIEGRNGNGNGQGGRN